MAKKKLGGFEPSDIARRVLNNTLKKGENADLLHKRNVSGSDDEEELDEYDDFENEEESKNSNDDYDYMALFEKWFKMLRQNSKIAESVVPYTDKSKDNTVKVREILDNYSEKSRETHMRGEFTDVDVFLEKQNIENNIFNKEAAKNPEIANLVLDQSKHQFNVLNAIGSGRDLENCTFTDKNGNPVKFDFSDREVVGEKPNRICNSRSASTDAMTYALDHGLVTCTKPDGTKLEMPNDGYDVAKVDAHMHEMMSFKRDVFMKTDSYMRKEYKAPDWVEDKESFKNSVNKFYHEHSDYMALGDKLPESTFRPVKNFVPGDNPYSEYMSADTNRSIGNIRENYNRNIRRPMMSQMDKCGCDFKDCKFTDSNGKQINLYNNVSDKNKSELDLTAIYGIEHGLINCEMPNGKKIEVPNHPDVLAEYDSHRTEVNEQILKENGVYKNTNGKLDSNRAFHEPLSDSEKQTFKTLMNETDAFKSGKNPYEDILKSKGVQVESSKSSESKQPNKVVQEVMNKAAAIDEKSQVQSEASFEK